MRLVDVIERVKDRDLSKEQLEDYYAMLSELLAQIHMELADREKEHALFIDESEEKTNAAREAKFAVTESGQREIVLKRYVKAAEHLKSGIKSRIYSKLS